MDDSPAANEELATSAGAAVGIGGATLAALVSACCAGPAVGPLVVALLGASGAVAFEGLRPFTTPLLVLSALAIATSFWLQRRSLRSCGVLRRRALAYRISMTLSGLSVIVWVVSLAAILWAHFA